MWTQVIPLRRYGAKVPKEAILDACPWVGWLELDGRWANLSWAETCSPPFEVLPSLYEPGIKIKRASLFIFGTERPGLSLTGTTYPQVWWCRPLTGPLQLDSWGRVRQHPSARY